MTDQPPATQGASGGVVTTLRAEAGLVVSIVTSILFLVFGQHWLTELSNVAWTLAMFTWLFTVMLWSAFAVVRHADCLAVRLGEPYGTLILTLAVITIEVVMVSAVMLTGHANPTLARDMMYSVLMIVLNGMIGIALLLGGYRHLQQEYNLQGANSFLAVLMPLAVLGLVLPQYTRSTPDASLTLPQSICLMILSVLLYGVFLTIQTVRHKDYFQPPHGAGAGHADDVHAGLEVRSTPYHGVLLMAYMVPIVLMSKKLAVIVDYGIGTAGAPAALGGFLVAILVLSPEALAAFQAALGNRLQRSINICLGSALATIGLTIPAVLVVGLITGQTVELGLEQPEELMLVLTLLLSMLTFGSSRTDLLKGAIHLVVFAAYVLLIFDG